MTINISVIRGTDHRRRVVAMPTFVPQQSPFPCERLAARRTRKPFRFDPGQVHHVRGHVLFMCAPVGECASTDGTQERAFPGVHPLVPLQPVLPPEPLSALSALVLLDGVVEPRVGRQITGALERLAADFALVRPIVRMHLDMLQQMTLVGEHLTAKQTWKFNLLLLLAGRRDCREYRPRYAGLFVAGVELDGGGWQRAVAVSLLVRLKTAEVEESLPAVRTLVGLQSEVEAVVTFEIAARRQTLATVGAFMLRDDVGATS